MTIEFALSVIAVAVVALVGFLIPAINALRRTAGEAHQLIQRLNAELSPLIGDLRLAIKNVNAAASEAKGGLQHASVLLHAMGEVGETVQEVHGMVRGQGESVVARLATLVTGVKAAASVVRDRFRRDRGGPEGGDGHGTI